MGKKRRKKALVPEGSKEHEELMEMRRVLLEAKKMLMEAKEKSAVLIREEDAQAI